MTEGGLTSEFPSNRIDSVRTELLSLGASNTSSLKALKMPSLAYNQGSRIGNVIFLSPASRVPKFFVLLFLFFFFPQ